MVQGLIKISYEKFKEPGFDSWIRQSMAADKAFGHGVGLVFSILGHFENIWMIEKKTGEANFF